VTRLARRLLAEFTGTALLVAVSGAHFNPVVSAADWAAGRRSGAGLPGRHAVAYMAAQTAGAAGGAVLANLMFALPAVSVSRTARSAPHLWIGEVVATAGLVLVIFALAGTLRISPGQQFELIVESSVKSTGPPCPPRARVPLPRPAAAC
jgi:glycerol uptake facilitator-like aquaporin